MNDFACIDYKKPLGMEDDMRTSTYRGHIYMTDTMLGNKLHAKIKEYKPYYVDPKLEEIRISDYKDNYVPLYGDPDAIANPKVDTKMTSLKNYEDCRLRFIPRPMRPASSVSQRDYIWRPCVTENPPSAITLPTAVKATPIEIDRSKPGYTKLLDPSATTSRLDYVYRSPQEVMHSVAAHDNITFWNWKDKCPETKRVHPGRDEAMINNMSAKECPKRSCEFPSMVKHVPHSGMTTEVRANYTEPTTRVIEFDLTHVRNRLVYQRDIPSSNGTEYQIYGSGKHTVQYV